MSKPSVLIATPAYGGLVTTEYLGSIITTMLYFEREGINCQVYTLKNESLIPRGRNSCAWYALTHGPDGVPFDKILFIDADMGFQLSDVKRLLESDKRVVGGTYPVKSYPIALAVNPLEEDRKHFSTKRSVADLLNLRKERGNERGEVKMRHIPTGFMKIDTSVLVELMPHVRTYAGTASSGEAVRHWDFFPIGPRGEGNDVPYESEDWAFCSLVREKLGEDIWLDTHVVTKHAGSHLFSAGNV